MAEGCYGEACLRYNRQYSPDQFSGQDEPLTDFPVGFENQNDFPVEKPVSIWSALGLATVWLLSAVGIAIVVGIVIASIGNIVMQVGWWVLTPFVIIGLLWEPAYKYLRRKNGRAQA